MVHQEVLGAAGTDPTTVLALLRETEDPAATPGWIPAAVATLLQPVSRAVLRVHRGSVHAALFSPDGRQVASAGDDRLAALIERYTPAGEAPIIGAAAFQLADGLARVIDQLHYEEVRVASLVDLDLGAFAEHWQASLGRLRLLVDHWPAVLAKTGSIDRAERRNRLLGRVTAGWRAAPPAPFVVAAGITTAAPAIARLLRTVADLERGMVVLPGLDRAMAAEEWEALGPTRPDPENSARPMETHPQYHLKLLLDRMRASREEVVEWDATSAFDGPEARAPFVSLLFAPADYSALKVGDTGTGIPVDVHTIPVVRDGRVIGIVEAHTNRMGVRAPGALEDAYLEAADVLSGMVHRCEYPTDTDKSVPWVSPRVGDGMIRVNADGVVVYASPNAVSAYRRLGLAADLEQLGDLLAVLIEQLDALLDDVDRVFLQFEDRFAVLLERRVELPGLVRLGRGGDCHGGIVRGRATPRSPAGLTVTGPG